MTRIWIPRWLMGSALLTWAFVSPRGMWVVLVLLVIRAELRDVIADLKRAGRA